MGRNTSCVRLLHITHLDHLLKLLNSELIFRMFKLISGNNKKLINDLLNRKIISYSVLCFDLLKLFYTSQQKMIPRSQTRDVLNSFIYSYLLSLMNNSFSNENLTQCASSYLDCAMHLLALKFSNRLNTCYIREFDSSFVSSMKTVDLSSDTIDFAQEVLSERIKCNLINIDKSYQSFLIPLEQDYTKSSKGYCSQITLKKTNLHAMNEVMESEERSIMEIFDMVVKWKNKQVQNAAKSIGYTGMINSNIIDSNHYDSDSDDESVIFAVHSDEEDNIQKFVEYDSDSDGIVFSENCSTERLCTVARKTGDHNKVFTKDSVTSNCYSNGLEIQVKQDDEFDESNSSFIEFVNVSSSEDSDSADDWDAESETGISFESNSFEPFNIPDFENQQHFSCGLMIGGGLINPCFEEDDTDLVLRESSHIKSINDMWNDSMKDVASEPRESRRVSFVPSSELVSVHSYEVEDDDDYRYSLHVLNRLRFQNRISDFEPIIAPYLTQEHRAKVYASNYCCRR